MADEIQTDGRETGGSVTEPATQHDAGDVAEGGFIGAVGGAIVGALAGGPLGAVIGAVVGGAASAGAVEAVEAADKYNQEQEALAQEAPVPDDSSNSTCDVMPTDTPFFAEAAGAPQTMLDPLVSAQTAVPVPSVSTSEPTPPDMSAAAQPDGSAPAWDLNSEIRERAYALYVERGRVDGRDVEDWLEAESQILKG